MPAHFVSISGTRHPGGSCAVFSGGSLPITPTTKSNAPSGVWLAPSTPMSNATAIVSVRAICGMSLPPLTCKRDDALPGSPSPSASPQIPKQSTPIESISTSLSYSMRTERTSLWGKKKGKKKAKTGIFCQNASFDQCSIRKQFNSPSSGARKRQGHSNVNWVGDDANARSTGGKVDLHVARERDGRLCVVHEQQQQQQQASASNVNERCHCGCKGESLLLIADLRVSEFGDSIKSQFLKSQISIVNNG